LGTLLGPRGGAWVFVEMYEELTRLTGKRNTLL